MWPFGRERRRGKRLSVRWEARLHCRFSGLEETLQAVVADVSQHGVKLHLKRMQIGSYHLVVSAEDLELLELEIPLEGEALRAAVEIRWYDWLEDERVFAVGTQFVDLPAEKRSALKRIMKRLPRT